MYCRSRPMLISISAINCPMSHDLTWSEMKVDTPLFCAATTLRSTATRPWLISVRSSELRTEINQGLVAVLRSVVAEQKSGVSTFISDQVKSWDMGQLIALIEINIGRDLQYIRFNGSLIGGLAGLALYTLEYLLRLL